jgi:D-sedoheptulose 7-phosphate isomerase
MSIKQSIEDSIALKNLILKDQSLIETIDKASQAIITSFRNGGKVMFCGNGGSAADAQHLAAELSGRFYYDRDPLPAEALHVNTSYLTAVANDYGYDEVFSRMVKGSGKKGDVLVGLSTSGNSKNILKAFETAKAAGMTTVGFTGATGGKMKDLSNYLINIPSENTARIQEAHIMIGHILCEIVESNIYPQ